MSSVYYKGIICFAASVLFLGVVVGGVSAELVPPNWMPNAPIMAGTQVILLWLPVPSAVKYNVYLDGKKVGESASVQYIIPLPEAPGDHKLEVAGVEANGTEGKKSTPGIVRIITIEAPNDIMVRTMDDRISLRWEKIKGAVIYNVYKSESEKGEYKFLVSLQDESFNDPKVTPGKPVFYQVTAKDLGGKESPRSKVVRAEIQKVAKVDVDVVYKLKVVKTKYVDDIEFFGKESVVAYGDLKLGPDGFLYFLDMGRSMISKIDRGTRDVVLRFGEMGEGPGKFRQASKIAIYGDQIYITDPIAKMVRVFRTDGKFDFEFLIPTPEKKEILDPIFPHLRAQGINPLGIAVDPKKKVLYVSDVNFNTIYKLDLRGKLLGHIGHGGHNESDMASPTEMAVDNDGMLSISEPTSHRIKIFDPESGKLLRIIGKVSNGFIGGFIGIYGMNFDKSGNLVVCDSGVHSIQVFDGKTGKYLYSIGNEEGIADPAQKDRALLGFTYGTGANVDDKGVLYIYRGDKKVIHIRQLLQ